MFPVCEINQKSSLSFLFFFQRTFFFATMQASCLICGLESSHPNWHVCKLRGFFYFIIFFFFIISLCGTAHCSSGQKKRKHGGRVRCLHHAGRMKSSQILSNVWHRVETMKDVIKYYSKIRDILLTVIERLPFIRWNNFSGCLMWSSWALFPVRLELVGRKLCSQNRLAFFFFSCRR